jgi:hypothetical protein
MILYIAEINTLFTISDFDSKIKSFTEVISLSCGQNGFLSWKV